MRNRLLRYVVAGCSLLTACIAQNINTVAGNSTWGLVYNVAVDNAGNVYVPDSTKHQIYKVDTQGVSTVIAGTGRAGYSGDGAQATDAQLNGPIGVAVGADGTVYFADNANDRIRKIAPGGIITTVAGSVGGFTGDGGAATAARLNGPVSVALDAAGNLYFTDVLNFRIRRISTAGVITTVAGTGRVSLSGDGGPATSADSAPCWMAVGPDGSLYFTDDGDARFFGSPRVRKVTNGLITTVAGGGTRGFTGDGGPATAAQFRSVSGVAVDQAGNVYVADANGARIRRVDSAGMVTTFAGTGTAGAAGDGGPAVSAQLNWPTGLTVDSAGGLYVVDRNSFKVRRIALAAAPSIRSTNSVIPSFLGASGFSSNTYLEIYGLNLSQTTRLWAGTDFSGANAPTSLDGVSVSVNGRAAFIYYVSPTQININTPDDSAVGPVTIQVRNSNGVSNSVTATRGRVSPTLHTVPQFSVRGSQHVVAQTPDFRSYIGTPGMVEGIAFRAVRPGESVVMFALGCGPTLPETRAGVVAAQASRLASTFQLRIGGVVAEVPFAGVVVNSIGLYQINAVIPQVPAGEQRIELVVDGVGNGQNLVITVGQ